MRILLIGLLMMSPLSAFAGGATEQFESLGAADTLERVEVRSGTADVRVRTLESSDIDARVVARVSDRIAEQVDLELTVERDGTAALVTFARSAEDEDGSFSRPIGSEIALELIVPEGVALFVNNGMGNVRIESFAGAIRVSVGSGDIRGSGMRLTGPSSFGTGMGGISLQVESGRGFIESANSGFGRVHIWD